jgi:hypothetical protein
MRALLRRELAETLASAGWVPATPVRESRFTLAQFVRPLHDDLAATASVTRASAIPDRLPVRITEVLVGVCYEPLRRLWPLFGDRYELALCAETIWPEDEPPDHDRCLKVSSAQDADEAVATLARVIEREAVPFAEQYGGLEGLLAEFEAREASRHDEQMVVALLAAAGRWDEARAALARYRAQTGDRAAREMARQIERYIDGGGDPAIVPRQPPPSPSSERPSLSDMWREGRARDEAVKAVKRVGPEADRDALRSALERELAARGLSESPLWLERTLDHLHDSPAEQARALSRGIGTAADLAVRAIRGLREHRDPPDLSPPAWLDPPDRAAYPVVASTQARWTEVQLDEPARSYLERVYAAIPRPFGSTALATAWLAWDEGPRERLVVSLGQERVGAVTPAAAAAYRLVMDRAAERDELPSVPARLTSRQGGHLLEVQLPAGGS